MTRQRDSQMAEGGFGGRTLKTKVTVSINVLSWEIAHFDTKNY